MENLKIKETLHDISNQYIDTLVELENEIKTPDQIKEMMHNISDKWDKKFGNLINVAQELNYTCEMIDKEIGRLEKRYAIRSKNLESIKEYMKNEMIFTGKTKFETPLYTISLRASESTEVNNAEFIDYAADKNLGQFLKVKVEPDKTEIKKYLKEGNELPFVKIVSNQNLSIK